MFDDYYKNKRVLVTGHTGFKGSWLTLWLRQLGAKVAGFSAYLPSEPCNFEVLGLQKLIQHNVGDIRNLHDIMQVFDDFQPQVVFHLAAQSIVRRSYDEPKLTFDTNVMGTVNVLECIRKSDCVEVGVIITSDKCYKNVEWVWGYREDDQLGGDDPYSASKGCAEIAINSYCQCYFNREKQVNVASTRAGNVIGGGDWAEDRIVPDCMRAWSEGKEVSVRNPRATRPWQHVLEPLSGYLWLGVLLGNNELKTGESFNFGPKTDVIQPVGILIDIFKKYWDKAQWKMKGDDSIKKESGLLKLCCDKALSSLNWQAILSFEETVEFTALWYKEFFKNGENMLEFSTKQIEQYCSLAKDRGMQWAKSR
ncbi:CDP-glucose 4,6-dehydratase [bacterium]|nr:CDP-glucose 4,6-dehydratase [bacterium]